MSRKPDCRTRRDEVLNTGIVRRNLSACKALSGLLFICLLVAPSAAQTNPSPAFPAPVNAQPDAKTLMLQLDRLLGEHRYQEAHSVYLSLEESRASSVEVGIELVSRQVTSSELTVRSVCTLAATDVPAELITSVLKAVLPFPSLSDWTKMHCIDRLTSGIDSSFRDQLLQLATEIHRDPNLRISALKVANAKWPLETRPTLVQLVQSAQQPVVHHKALQYLAGSGDTDVLPLIELFVLNRDPATAGTALSKEYGLLILRRRWGAEVLPLLDAILRDESWPSEIQDRTIDLLEHSDLPGGRTILTNARVHASTGLRTRIDAALTGVER